MGLFSGLGSAIGGGFDLATMGFAGAYGIGSDGYTGLTGAAAGITGLGLQQQILQSIMTKPYLPGQSQSPTH